MTDTRPLRNASLDGLKFLAAIAIVVHHVAAKSIDMSITHRYGWVLDYISYWGLTFFFMASGFFHGPTGRRGGAWRKRRVARLMLPYLAWTGFYVLFAWLWPHLSPAIDWLLYGQTFTLSAFPDLDVVYVLFFAGACNVLWYLPVVAAFALVADLTITSRRSLQTALLLALALTMLTHMIPLSPEAASRWSFYYSAPWWFVAYALGMMAAVRVPKTDSRLPRTGLAVAAILATGLVPLFPALMSGSSALLGWVITSLLNLAASWLLLTEALSGSDPFFASRFSRGGPLVLGVYVVHTAWIVVWSIIAARLELSPAVWIVIGTAVSVGGSVASAAVLRRIRWLRWAVE